MHPDLVEYRRGRERGNAHRPLTHPVRVTERRADMQPTNSNAWRNRPVERSCTKCNATFTGKYNSTTCPPCKTEVRASAYREFQKNNPDYWRKWQKTAAGRNARKKVVLKSYGLSVEEYQALLDGQENACAICGANPGTWRANGGGLVIDHDHSTGQVRGLLCPPCNRGLGQFEDDPARLNNALAYLRKERS